MKFYSTRNKKNIVTLKEAILQGIADDGGLFMPTEIPRQTQSFFRDIRKRTFTEVANRIANLFFRDDIPSRDIESIVLSAFDFESPLIPLNHRLSVLELFHGPTLAFKDFGARFMARILSYLMQYDNSEITILVATSGDTGSAVAHGFHNQPGIDVILLYPSGMVSDIQEKQLTTLAGNITALEIDGTFDDCQRLVKTAFLNQDIKRYRRLSSANSINIARLIPQSFYYFAAYSQLENHDTPLIMSVPSGNLGNLTAGLIAKEMGLPVQKFIAALNVNKVFHNYMNSGEYQALSAIPTLSNAMDVGNPSNFSRILALYGNDHTKITDTIYSASFSDLSTRQAIKEIYSKFGYIMDPHGSVGYLAMKKYLSENTLSNFHGIILETAHPAKFSSAVNEELNIEVEIPKVLKESLSRKKNAIKISKNFSDFKSFILEN